MFAFSSRSASCVAAAALLAAAPAASVDPAFRLHADEFPLTPLSRLIVGVNARMVPLSTITTNPSYVDGVALEAGPAWDFSSATGDTVILQAAPVAAGWTAYVPETSRIPNRPCGFDRPENDLLFVQDIPSTGARDTVAIDHDGAGTFWLRAWAIDECGTPSTGDQELRLCFWPQPGRPEVPFMVFANTDGARRFMAPGDAPWQSGVFTCGASSPTTVTQGSPCQMAAGGQNAVLSDGNETLGRFTGRVVRAGTVTLPSGHVLDTILVEILASFRAMVPTPFGCIDSGERTRQYQLMWLVPGYGPIVQVRSPEDQGPDLSTWTTTSSTVIAHGLLPPLRIQVDAVTSSTVRVSWDPGRVTSSIDGFVVHWGTQPGSVTAPPFSSGMLPIAGGTSTTLRGLQPETTYWISVTSVSAYTDPRAMVTTDYESIALPDSIGADVDGDGVRDTSYPPETSATTAVAPPASLAVNRQVRLLPGGPTPPVASVFDPGCATSPFTICADEVVPGALGSLVLPGEADGGGQDALSLYEHSDAVETMKVRRVGLDLHFLPN
jgi:hypothetical protein